MKFQKALVINGVLLALLMGCAESQKSLDRKAAEGRYDELAGFVEMHYRDSIKCTLVATAISHLLDPNNKESIGREKIIDILTGEETEQLAHRMLPLIEAKKPMQIDSLVLQTIRSYAAEEDYPSLTRLGEEYGFLATDRLAFMAEAVTLAQEIITARDRKANAQSTIPRLESELESQNTVPVKTQMLEAYMVADVGFGGYEIALAQYTYWGKVASESHAVLFTKSTSFGSKGWFNLRVRRLPDSEVKLKEEFGSFNQTWPVFEEVTDEDLRINDSTIRDLAAKLDSLKWARNAATEEVLKIAWMKRELDSVLNGSVNEGVNTATARP